jgi:type IV pilus assembly protein PilM
VAAAQRILAIDFGSCNLKLAEFAIDGSGVPTLLNYVIQDLGLDPNKEQERFPFMVAALTEALKSSGIKPAPAYCSISGQYVFTRFVKLPPVAPDQLDQMIGFEAQQNVPFPIHEVVWDYQLLGGGGDREYEVVIVAVKGDLVEEVNTILGTVKIPLKAVDVAPLAVINALRFNYPDRTEPTLLIDIGAKTTNLAFLEPNKVFSRVVPIAGYQISQNISNEFQEPYVAAETLKKGKGFVGLGGAYADPPDPAAARISKIARSVYSRLYAELSRSISFYRNQQGGAAPKIVLLTGGTVSMAYSDLFFKEKLSTASIESFNALQAVKVGPGVEQNRLAADSCYMGVLVGLALRASGACPVEINLIPLSAKSRNEMQGRVPYLAAAAVCLILAFGVLIGGDFRMLASEDAAAAQMQGDVDGRKALSKRITEADAKFKKAQLQLDAIRRLQAQGEYWTGLLDFLNRKIPTEIWINQMEISYQGAPVEVIPVLPPAPSGPAKGPQGAPAAPEHLNMAPTATELNLRGFYEASQPPEILNSFAESLADGPFFDKVEIIDRESPDADQVAVRFYLKATLKPGSAPDLKP